MTNPTPLHEQLISTPSVSIADTCELYQSTESLTLLKIESPLCNAVIALQGAQLLEFTPKNSAPWLWLSPKATFSESCPIRGGIPICAPWFGVNKQDPGKPKHGFVRTRCWQLIDAAENDIGEVELTFTCTSEERDLPLFPHPFSLNLVIRLSDHIDISFSVLNTGQSLMPFSWALHSYFNVDSLKDVRVEGLDQHPYLDATQNFLSVIQNGSISFKSEVDRVYESVSQEQSISGSPSLSIKGDNCPTAIVWNPGIKLATKMADITADHYDQYICLERGAAFANSWDVLPQQSVTSTLTILPSK